MGYLKFLLDSILVCLGYVVGDVSQTPQQQRMAAFFIPGALACLLGLLIFAWIKHILPEKFRLRYALITIGSFLIYYLVVYLIAFEY